MQDREKNIELRSEDVQDVMGAVPPAILRWGISVIGLVLLLLLLGCYLFKYPDRLSGAVTLTTESIVESRDSISPVCSMLLPAKGSGKARVGQRALVRLDNFPEQEFGFIEGKVAQISNTPDSNGMYLVEIRFPKGLVTNYGIQLPITKQMQGNADIITEDVRLLVRFFNPIKILLLRYT
ncbi:MAG TPA: hypothetical protein VFP20_10915 [Bacteroidales bacterium]|nr:hypothetical protein [Bacteroidales bacterium]